MENADAVQLESDVPFNPVVDIASAVKHVIRQAMVFEYRVGNGRLLVASFRFDNNDPAAVWLKNKLVSYAASSDFAPADFITVKQLKGVINAPLVSGAKNSNTARNPNDMSSLVRAGEFAQP
jgi:hypothetical protein